MSVTVNDVYALGLLVGRILKDTDPATRDPVLDLIRKLERKAAEQ